MIPTDREGGGYPHPAATSHKKFKLFDSENCRVGGWKFAATSSRLKILHRKACCPTKYQMCQDCDNHLTMYLDSLPTICP
jgi:hypothetical protein